MKLIYFPSWIRCSCSKLCKMGGRWKPFFCFILSPIAGKKNGNGWRWARALWCSTPSFWRIKVRSSGLYFLILGAQQHRRLGVCTSGGSLGGRPHCQSWPSVDLVNWNFLHDIAACSKPGEVVKSAKWSSCKHEDQNSIPRIYKVRIFKTSA